MVFELFVWLLNSFEKNKKLGPAVVPQFETCGREIHPEFFQNFLPRRNAYIFRSCFSLFGVS